jgi:FxLD family lantipeptide
MPGDVSVLDRPAVEEGDFDLDVRVIIAYSSASSGRCPTDDGCGNTCGTNDSSCSSTFEMPAA